MPQNFFCSAYIILADRIFNMDKVICIQFDLVDIFIPAYTTFVFDDLQ